MKRLFALTSLASLASALVVSVLGCKTYYENAGMRIRAGSVAAPVEASEPTSSVNVRLLFFLDGVDLYVAKGSAVEMDYCASSGGSWLTGASTQTVHVAVSPTNLCGAASRPSR